MNVQRLEEAYQQLRAWEQDELMLVGVAITPEARAWAEQRGIECLESPNVNPAILYLINPAALDRL